MSFTEKELVVGFKRIYCLCRTTVEKNLSPTYYKKSIILSRHKFVFVSLEITKKKKLDLNLADYYSLDFRWSRS